MNTAVASTRIDAPAREGRNRYFDLLRVVALLRVVVLHTVGAYWLHVVFPAVGVMFGLAGSLMARSLSQRTGAAVVGSRLRRLLPPLWVYGVVAVLAGWESIGSGGHFEVTRLFYWFLPLRDPHQGALSRGFVDTLWYVRAYLWFVVFSPLLLRLFRRAPRLTILAPLLLLPIMMVIGQRQWEGRGQITDVLEYGACWLLGFAEYDGLLRRIPTVVWAVVAIAGGAAGLTLSIMFPFTRADYASISPVNAIGYGLWSAAVVLVLLRLRPDMSWLRRRRHVDAMVGALNARAVTIYLWHDAAVALSLSWFVALGLNLPRVTALPVVLALTGAAVLLVGWVEDLAAGRRPRLLPNGRETRPRHGRGARGRHERAPEMVGYGRIGPLLQRLRVVREAALPTSAVVNSAPVMVASDQLDQ